MSLSVRHMGDKLLASAFITSAAANLSVTLLTGESEGDIQVRKIYGSNF